MPHSIHHDQPSSHHKLTTKDHHQTSTTGSRSMAFPGAVRETFTDPARKAVRKLHVSRESMKFQQSRAVSTGRCNTGLEFTRRSLKTQGLSGTLIETQSDLVEIGLRVDGQVGFLREVLS